MAPSTSQTLLIQAHHGAQAKIPLPPRHLKPHVCGKAGRSPDLPVSGSLDSHPKWKRGEMLLLKFNIHEEVMGTVTSAGVLGPGGEEVQWSVFQERPSSLGFSPVKSATLGAHTSLSQSCSHSCPGARHPGSERKGPECQSALSCPSQALHCGGLRGPCCLETSLVASAPQGPSAASDYLTPCSSWLV